jgi:hypothetical protein
VEERAQSHSGSVGDQVVEVVVEEERDLTTGHDTTLGKAVVGTSATDGGRPLTGHWYSTQTPTDSTDSFRIRVRS